MALRQIKIDDLTGTEAPDAEEYRIRLGELDGSIHLTERSHAALAALVNGEGGESLAFLLRPSLTLTRHNRPATASGGATADEIRAWAHENGIEVSTRGRIPAAIRNKFYDANPNRKG